MKIAKISRLMFNRLEIKLKSQSSEEKKKEIKKSKSS